MVGRLLPYKRFDTAIEACKQIGIPLTIVGTGPDEQRLRALAGPDVSFRGRLPDSELRETFSQHSVVLAPGIEDFGFGPLEGNYAGRPVVAIALGGALETMIDGTTGVLARSYDAQDWTSAISTVLSRAWDPWTLRNSTARFSQESFTAAVGNWVGVSAFTGSRAEVVT